MEGGEKGGGSGEEGPERKGRGEEGDPRDGGTKGGGERWEVGEGRREGVHSTEYLQYIHYTTWSCHT